MTRQVTLSVNDKPVTLDYFAQDFIDHVVAGMLGALEGTGPIKNLTLSIEGDKVAIDLNGGAVATNTFAGKIVTSTMVGMVSSLKGGADASKLKISLVRGS